MKLIICGGRNNRLSLVDFNRLTHWKAIYHITELVSGGCRGIDQDGESWAKHVGIPVKLFPADWSLGNGAGPIRNQAMADYCAPGDFCAVFPGGRGTADMRRRAETRGLIILEPKV